MANARPPRSTLAKSLGIPTNTAPRFASTLTATVHSYFAPVASSTGTRSASDGWTRTLRPPRRSQGTVGPCARSGSFRTRSSCSCWIAARKNSVESSKGHWRASRSWVSSPRTCPPNARGRPRVRAPFRHPANPPDRRMGQAAKLVRERRNADAEHIAALDHRLRIHLDRIQGTAFNGNSRQRIPGILSVSC